MEFLKSINKKLVEKELSGKAKSEIVKKAKQGEDLGKPGKNFEKIEKKAAQNSKYKNPKAVAGAVFWKLAKKGKI